MAWFGLAIGQTNLEAMKSNLKFIISCLLFLILGSVVDTAHASKFEIYAFVSSEGESLEGTTVQVFTDDGACVAGQVVPNGKAIRLPLPAGKVYHVRFFRPGYIRKQVVVDLSSASASRYRKCFRFEVELFRVPNVEAAAQFYTVAYVRYSKRKKRFVYAQRFSYKALHKVDRLRTNSLARN